MPATCSWWRETLIFFSEGSHFRMIQRMSLRTRFILFALACLIPLFLALVYFLDRSVERNREHIVDNQFAIASLVDRSVTSFFNRNIADLEKIAANSAVISMNPAEVDQVLGQATVNHSEFSALFLVDINGEIISAPTTISDEAVADLDEQIQGTMANQEVRVSSRINVSDEVVNIVVTVPVVNTEEIPADGETSPPKSQDDDADSVTAPGQVVGALGVVIRMEQLEQLVLPLARGNTEVAIVRGNDEIFLGTAGVRSNPDIWLADQATELELARNGGTGEFSGTSIDDVNYMGVYQPLLIENMTWATIVNTPAPQSFAESLMSQGMVVLMLAVVTILAMAVVCGELAARPLRELVRLIDAIRQGDYSHKIEPMGTGETRELSTALAGGVSDVEAQSHELEEIEQFRDVQTRQMRDLLRRTLRLQENEQRRIAGEIHDAVSPLITGALYQARALLMSNGSAGHAERESALENVGGLLERATEELHGVIFDLRPPDLDDLGVVAAIEAYIGNMRRPSLNVRLELGDEPPGLTSEVRLGLYRIMQEALHNAMRHSGADEALVRIESTDEFLRLTIRDNGSGFDPDTAIRPTSLGLLSMRERAAAIGATFTVVSRQGGGAAIIVERAHTGSVMSDDVLADLMLIDRAGQTGGEQATDSSEPVHNGFIVTGVTDEESGS